MRATYLKKLCCLLRQTRKKLLSSLFLLLASSFVLTKLKSAPPRSRHVPSHHSVASTCASLSDHVANDNGKGPPTDPRPTLVFSGTVRLMAFVLGASSYIKDAFHMHNVRVSTIGGGSIASMVLTLNLSPMHVLAMGMHIRQHIFRRPMLCYVVREHLLLDWLVQELKLAGLTNRRIAQCCLGLPFKAKTPEETMRYMFRTPSVLDNGKWAIDGSFSALYGIPEDADKEKVVRITPWPFLPGDVKCRHWRLMHVIGFFFPLSVRWQKKEFILGYNTAKNHHDLLINKGLIPYAASIKRPCLETHLESFQEMSILRTAAHDSGLTKGCMDVIHGAYAHNKFPMCGSLHAMQRRAQSVDNVPESWCVDSDDEYMLSAEDKQLFVVEENTTGERG